MEGLWAGLLSYGYRIFYDRRTGEAGREIDEDVRGYVVEIVETMIETGNETALASDLNKRGVSCARAETWRADHVRKLHVLSQDAEGWAKFVAGRMPEQLESAYEALVRVRTESPAHVAKMMNRGQWAHPMPGQWDASKVRNIALNPALAGLRVYQGKVIGKGKWPAIIKEDRHNAVVAKLGDPSRRAVRDGTR
jgi:site-specific DNA recombinase